MRRIAVAFILIALSHTHLAQANCPATTAGPMDFSPEFSLQSLKAQPTGKWIQDRKALRFLADRIIGDELVWSNEGFLVAGVLLRAALKFDGKPSTARWLGTSDLKARACLESFPTPESLVPSEPDCSWELPSLNIKAPLHASREGEGPTCASISRLLTYVRLGHEFLSTWSNACLANECKF